MPTPEFDAAVTRSRSLPKQSNANLLALYGLFKQATEGDVSGKKPGRLDLRGRAKYQAWESHKGKPQADAEAEYIALVARLGA